MMPFYVQLIVGGVEDGKGYVYNLDAAGGYTQESRFTATGSGSLTALGYLEDSYRPGLTTKDAIKIAAKALLIAMQRDSATGNNLTIAAITSKGYEEYTQKDVEKMAK